MTVDWELEYAAKFVAKWEGFLADAYLDTIASPPVYTIGYGHSEYAAPPHVHAGDHWTHEHALTVLTNDLKATSHAVKEKIHVSLTNRQRMALISAAYNLGTGILDTLAPLINAGHIKQAADKLLEYDHAGGVVVQGLLNRRRAERWLMLHNHLPSPHRVVKHQPQRKAASHAR
jgi:lysozyme